MLASRAQALAGVLGAAFPGLPGETLELYAAKLGAFDEQPAAQAVDDAIEGSRFAPAWADLRHLIVQRLEEGRRGVPELTAGTVPPPAEFHEAWRQLRSRLDHRGSEFRKPPLMPIGEPIVRGGHVSVVSPLGHVLWEYELSGRAAVDDAELVWGAQQTGLQVRQLRDAVRKYARTTHV